MNNVHFICGASIAPNLPVSLRVELTQRQGGARLRRRVPALRGAGVIALGVGGPSVKIASEALELARDVLVPVLQVDGDAGAVGEGDVELKVVRVGEMQRVDDLRAEGEPAGCGVRRGEVDGAGGHNGASTVSVACCPWV